MDEVTEHDRESPLRGSQGPRTLLLGWMLAGVLLVGALLRIAMAFESFWLDEAWSYFLAKGASGPWEILTELRHDNNHILNSWWIHAIQPWVDQGHHWFWYRLPSLLAGIASLLVFHRIALRFGRLEASVGTLLLASSYPMIQAAGQARGYSVSLFCGLLFAWLAFRRHAGDRRHWLVILLWVSAIFGMLAHLTFVYVMVAVALWRAVDDWREGTGLGPALREQIVCHALPAIALVALYFVFYRDMAVGGGPDYDRFVVVRQAFAQTLALPRRGPLTWVALGVGGSLVVLALAWLVRAGDRRWVFLATVLGLAPMAAVLVSDPKVFYARYLLACFPWFYLACALALAHAMRRGGLARVAAWVTLIAFVGLNLEKDRAVLATGRNDYLQSVELMLRETPTGSVDVGSDHDFRNGTVLRYYAGVVPSGERIRYHKTNAWPSAGPEWYVRHNWRAGSDPEPRHSPAPGHWYRLVESYEHGPGDGFRWFLYRHERVAP